VVAKAFRQAKHLVQGRLGGYVIGKAMHFGTEFEQPSAEPCTLESSMASDEDALVLIGVGEQMSCFK